MQGLRLRRVADTSGGEEVVVLDPATGARRRTVLKPEGHEDEPWPLAGVRFDGEPPERARVPTSTIDLGVAEGWVELEGEQVVHRPGGPPEAPYRVTHTFRHAEAIIFRFLDGEHRYRVVHQPDKYHDGPAGTDADPTARVDWFYDIEREEG
jgi:hypothetical protein